MLKIIKRIRIYMAHYQTKLLFAFLLCTLIPISITGIIAYQLSYNIASRQITDSAVATADQINLQLNYRITQAENVADTLQFDMYKLLQSKKLNVSDYINTISDIRNNIYLFKTTFNFYHIYVFLKQDYLGSNESLYFFPIEDFKQFNISPEILNKIGASSIWFCQDHIILPYMINPTTTAIDGIICSRAQINQNTFDMDYAFSIVLDLTDFIEFLPTTNQYGVKTYILTLDNRVISKAQSDSFLSVDEIKNNIDKNTNLFEKNGISYYCLPLNNNWYQVTEIPEYYIHTSTNSLLKWNLVTIIISVCITSAIILIIIRRLSHRVQILSQAMNEYQLGENTNQSQILAELKYPHNVIDYDEIDYLGIAFTNMKTSIQNNLDSIINYKISEERLKYQLLQSQINPHFLYNILGSIQNCQSMGKLDIASQMITDLTKFYRLSLRKSGELITLKDEIEIAVLYLRIEKLCHSNTIDWTISLADGIENFAICKFTLQPFLENSILHGISGQTPNINIDITADYGDTTVIIVIKDNGIGIPVEKLEEIKKDLADKSVHYDRHFGICNVNARISKEYYGNGLVTIDSSIGHGTTVTIEYSQIEV